MREDRETCGQAGGWGRETRAQPVSAGGPVGVPPSGGIRSVGPARDFGHPKGRRAVRTRRRRASRLPVPSAFRNLRHTALGCNLSADKSPPPPSTRTCSLDENVDSSLLAAGRPLWILATPIPSKPAIPGGRQPRLAIQPWAEIGLVSPFRQCWASPSNHRLKLALFRHCSTEGDRIHASVFRANGFVRRVSALTSGYGLPFRQNWLRLMRFNPGPRTNPP